MKRCPQCFRNYSDPELNYCLDDGASLINGPASGEPATAVLSGVGTAGEIPTRQFSDSEVEDKNERDASGVGHAVRAAAGKRAWILIGVAAMLAAVGYLAYRQYSASAGRTIDSIAVMPFVNGSGNADLEYLSDGMTETLFASLSQLPGVSVKARSSVFRYKGRDADPKTVGSELSVQAVLNGRVVQHGQDLLLNVELIDAANENVLWSRNYDRKASDVLSLQTDVARDIASNLQAKLTGSDDRKLAKNYTSSPEAYQNYLRGNYYWNKRGKPNIDTAVGYYQQAIALDPNYALAYAGLAEAYAQPTQQPGGMPKARDAALKALSLDNDLAEAHTALARVLGNYDFDFAGAERELKRALELNPNSGNAHARYAVLLASTGKFEAAEAEHRRSLELEPVSIVFNGLYGSTLLFAHRYDDAIVQLNKALELDKDFFLTHSVLSTAYQLKGDRAECVEQRVQAVERSEHPEDAARIRESFSKGGWEGYLRQMIEVSRGLRQPAYQSAVFYTALGEKDQAIAALNDSYQNHEAAMSAIKVDPLLDPLRDDPRFITLLNRILPAE
jgi:TolB-like protein/Tfp pilus assembly protein PilF